MRSLRAFRIAVAIALVFTQACQAFTTKASTPLGARSLPGTPFQEEVFLDEDLLDKPLQGHAGTEVEEEPYSGRFAVTLRPAILTLYGINGRFQSMDFMSGNPIFSSDSGDIEGKYGVALQIDYQVNRWLAFSIGADTRAYDVKSLNPIPALNVSVDSIDSTQFFLAARHLLPPLGAPGWNGSRGKFQPYTELSLNYLPAVDVGFEVDLSGFGSSNLRIDSTADGFFLAGFTAGAYYDLSRRWRLQFGTTYEYPITKMEADLSFDIAGTTVPLTAEFEPLGLIGFVGLTYVF